MSIQEMRDYPDYPDLEGFQIRILDFLKYFLSVTIKAASAFLLLIQNPALKSLIPTRTMSLFCPGTHDQELTYPA